MVTTHVGYLIVELTSFFRLGVSAPFDPILEQKKAEGLIVEKLRSSSVPHRLERTLNGELLLISWGSMEDLMSVYSTVRQLEGTIIERLKLYIVPESEGENVV